MVKTYRDLDVWKRSYEFCIRVYRVSGRFPKDERFGLTAQMRRAAVSVPSNIAEGCGRRTTPDFLRSLYIAYGSNCELETQILLATDLGFLEAAESKRLVEELGDIERMLKGLIRALEAKVAAKEGK
jgi:four helix bundle protein